MYTLCYKMENFQQEGGESSHVESIMAEGDRLNESQGSTTSAVHTMMRQDSTSSTTMRRESLSQDRNTLHVPVSETLPTDMSDTTESEAEKQSGIGKHHTVVVFRFYKAHMLAYFELTVI